LGRFLLTLERFFLNFFFRLNIGPVAFLSDHKETIVEDSSFLFDREKLNLTAYVTVPANRTVLKFFMKMDKEAPCVVRVAAIVHCENGRPCYVCVQPYLSVSQLYGYKEKRGGPLVFPKVNFFLFV
jgi:hypothetical protein